MKHPIECFLCFRGFLGIQVDIVPTIKAAASIASAFDVAPYLLHLSRNGITLGHGMTVAGGQIGVVDVYLAERTINAESFLHDISPISEKINTT